jgi:eukaryotic-like serine/threonine-protein kinase
VLSSAQAQSRVSVELATELVPLPAGQRQFGRYHLLYRIGTGGMANLYLARATGPDGFEKLIAIKRIHEPLCHQPDFLKMFKDEARLAARILHPHVVQVIELGQNEGAYYIAMEYVHGENLSALLRRARPEIPIVARIIADALAGLHAAHELRSVEGELLELVHRDLSPSNILIGYDGAVKVSDFGVARARGTLHITNAGTLKGKYAYMAPEQVRRHPVDRRADLFAVGTLLYEASTRSRLFRADTPGDTLTRIVSGKVPAPETLVPGYPPLLHEIVMRALDQEPDKRYQTAQEMQLALEDFIYRVGPPVTASNVAALMRSVFEDRIAAKDALLRQGLADLQFEPLPELEHSASSSLELPALPPPVPADAAPAPAVTGPVPVAAEDAGGPLEIELHALHSPLRRWALVGAAALLLAGGALAVWKLRGHTPVVEARRDGAAARPRSPDAALPDRASARRHDAAARKPDAAVRKPDAATQPAPVPVTKSGEGRSEATKGKRPRPKTSAGAKKKKKGGLFGNPYED